MSPIRRILLQYVNKSVTSAEEIATLIGCSKHKVYYVLEGKKHFYDYEVMTLCQHFSSLGKNDLSRQFLSAKYNVVPMGDVKINGCVLDENGEITKTMGRLIELFGRGEKDEGLTLIDDLLMQVNQLKQELKNLS